MSILTTDAWALALAAVMAMLLSLTTLTLARSVAAVSARHCACIVLLSSLALGFGLWSTNFVQVMSLWLPERPNVGMSWFVLPFAVATATQGCALLFLARREPDAAAITGAAFALAVGAGMTHCAALDELPGLLELQEDLPWIAASFVIGFVAFLGALWVWFRPRHGRSWRGRCERLLASLLGAAGILGATAQSLANSRLVLSACCGEPASPGRLLTVSIAALGCAALSVTLTIAVCCNRNRQRFKDRLSSLTDSMHERLGWENDLRRALSAGEFELHYQPEISIKTGRIVAAEALLRWRHPTKGIVGPSSFISLAEETGLMIPLGEWALREACRQARAWQIDLGASFPVAVNLSATQFRRQNIPQMIHAALADAGLDAGALEIELTESALMTNPEESARALKQLRRMGVSVAIDDFGTGYSSLSYLRRFPIDKLKIDRSFIRDLTPTDESIVRAIVSLARSVGLRVVAEGIESAEQLEFVTRLECDQWQGYHCCAPQPAACFAAMLMDRIETRTGRAETLAALVAHN
jgi:EAL domain-containing protein (putative c-di-GMP-specific phosphodiesterase class I)/NO-binding membrane sensor protein with MHYT domain